MLKVLKIAGNIGKVNRPLFEQCFIFLILFLKKKKYPTLALLANIWMLFLDRNLSLKLSKEVDRGEARCPRLNQLANSPSIEWPFAAMEEGGGLESLPFRLMMQDCTAVKTLLLKMKRVLQEVSF